MEWENIPEIEPDEWDREMLSEIEADPDCRSFKSVNMDYLLRLGRAFERKKAGLMTEHELVEA